MQILVKQYSGYNVSQTVTFLSRLMMKTNPMAKSSNDVWRYNWSHNDIMIHFLCCVNPVSALKLWREMMDISGDARTRGKVIQGPWQNSANKQAPSLHSSQFVDTLGGRTRTPDGLPAMHAKCARCRRRLCAIMRRRPCPSLPIRSQSDCRIMWWHSNRKNVANHAVTVAL